MKYSMNVPVAAAAVFVAVPYCLSLTAQWLYGWPDKPGYRKYVEALKPRRVYALTRTILEMLKYLKYTGLYSQSKRWYTENSSAQWVKGIPFGRRGNRLDLYHSPTMSKSGAALLPVVVFVYGGSWCSGERSTYCLLALRVAEELNASVICPDYSIYPKGNVLNMVQDISDSLMWVRENGHLFHLDKDNIVLIGHSAGGHLCALTALFLLEGVESLFAEPSGHEDTISSIKGIIGLSGVYDITQHYEHQKRRGVEYVSVMHKAMDGVQNFECFSPTARIRKLNQQQLARLPPVGLIHGTDDVVVPVESSVRLCELLTSLSAAASLYLLPKLDHNEVVMDLMAPDRRAYQALFSCVKQEYRRFVRPT